MNILKIKSIIAFGALITLTTSSCWSAAPDELLHWQRPGWRDYVMNLGAVIRDTSALVTDATTQARNAIWGDPNEKLLNAAKNGNDAELVKALEEKADVNTVDEYGNTPLHWATENGHAQIVNRLIEAEADMNKTNNRNGETPLMLAAARGHLMAIEQLVSHKADVDATNSSGQTALFIAASSGCLECKEEIGAIITALINGGAHVNMQNPDGWTPLMAATFANNPQAVDALLRGNANKNILNNANQTALNIAKDIVKASTKLSITQDPNQNYKANLIIQSLTGKSPSVDYIIPTI